MLTRRLLMGAALAPLLAMGCRGERAPSARPSSAAPRVVSLHDTTTEIVVGLGAADRLAAVVEPAFLSQRAERAVAGVPRLPGGPLSAESVLALQPDLVLGTDVVGEQQPELVAALEAAGRRALWIDPAGFDGLWRAVRRVAAALDRGEAAEAWIASLQAALPEPRPSRNPVRVLLYDCCDPPFVAAGRAPVSELLERLGAVNVFAGVDQDWSTVSWEAVSAADPELIVVHDYPWPGQRSADEKIERLRAHPALARSRAVREDRFLVLPLALVLEGPRTVEAVGPLEAALAPLRAARDPEAGP